ncbi:MAG: cytochrome c [Planctomycetaceae bacterium]|nr:cytochrome c [Planctomycetaceae bacterium]
MRLHHTLKSLCVLVPLLFLFSGAAPEGKMSLEKTATPQQLVNAIRRHADTLSEEYLNDPKRFEDNLIRDKITAKGGAIEALAQALEQAKNAPAEVHALAIRSAGHQIATAETFQQAEDGLKNVIANLSAQQKTGNFQELTWGEVGDLPNQMEEINYLYQGLRRTVRRSRDPEADALDAMTVAILAFPTEANENYAFDDAEIAEWKKYSRQMHDDFLAIAKAMREEDTDKARELYKNAPRSCAACHDKFREE